VTIRPIAAGSTVRAVTRRPYAVIVASESTTRAGSRNVITTRASGHVFTSGPSCSRCIGLLSTQRLPPSRSADKSCSARFTYA
jgi:hypothetical protein